MKIRNGLDGGAGFGGTGQLCSQSTHEHADVFACAIDLENYLEKF